MLKEHIVFWRKLEMLADLSLAAAVFSLVCPSREYYYLFFPYLGLWAGLLYFFGMYESFRIKRFADMLVTVWGAALIGMGIAGFAAYLLKIEDLSRLFVLLIFAGTAVLTSAEKFIAMAFFRHIRRKGYNSRNILIVGTGPRARQFMGMISRREDWGLRVAGLIEEDPDLMGHEINGFRVIGALKDVADIVHERVVDEVVFIVPRSWFARIEQVISFCEIEGIRVHVAIDVFDLKFVKAKQTNLENFLLLTFERTPVKMWHLLLKGIIDRLISGILLVVLAPLFIIIAAAVKFSSPGPVFYSQTRCGMNGRKFTLYKFRTMVRNAEQFLPELQKRNEMKGPAFKMKNDPRVTPLGRFLRKFSLDELPQLWNVFRCDMSLVGPRPPLPEEVSKYDSWQRRRLSMRPGITCLWQVQGRNRITDFNDWARLDLYYIDHWTIWEDFRILLKTVPAVILGIGAK